MHHLIFEGAELVGKSYLMNNIYNYIEKKYNNTKVILDGCHWFNTDVGVFGTQIGYDCILQYIQLLNI